MEAPARLKILVADRGGIITVGLVLVGVVLLAGGGFIYLNPPTQTVTETTDQQRVSTAVSTSAVVTGETVLYSPGERLEDMPVYLLSATPNMTLTVQSTVPDGQTVTVAHRLSLVHIAAREGQPFFAAERALIETEHSVSGGSVSDSATINVTAIQQEIGVIQGEIAGAGTLTTELRLVTGYETDLYDGELTATAPLQTTGSSYLIGGGGLSASDTRQETTTRTISGPRDLTTSAGMGVLGLLAVIAGAAIYRIRRGIDVVDLKTSREHAQYEEWISGGEFPTGAEYRFTSISSLEDLVDVAIDSEKRVIYDDELDAYAVVDGQVVYYFAPDPETIDPWLDA